MYLVGNSMVQFDAGVRGLVNNRSQIVILWNETCDSRNDAWSPQTGNALQMPLGMRKCTFFIDEMANVNENYYITNIFYIINIFFS